MNGWMDVDGARKGKRREDGAREKKGEGNANHEFMTR